MTTQTNLGAVIVQLWTCDRDYFVQVFAQMDEAKRREIAETAVTFCAMRVPWAPVTVDQMLSVWYAALQAPYGLVSHEGAPL